VPHSGRQQLTVNFRSQPEILKFANALFARCLLDFEALVPFEPQINPGPCVEFLWSERPPKQFVAEARAIEADFIARRIAAMVVPGSEPLVVDRSSKPPRLRNTRPGDIVLLFRSMSNVHLYEAALRDYGLNYYLVGGRAFFAQQEIYDILNLLRALENPQDSLSLAGTLRSPFCCLSDEALFVLARHGDGLWAGLNDESMVDRLPADQHERVARSRHFLTRWRSLKDRLPIAGLLNAVFADSGFDAAMRLEHLGERKLANLWKLLDLARTFDRSGLFGLAEFIARLGDSVNSQPREEQAATQPENADVIRLMSIHQAKGLEFPIVFVADLAGEVSGGAGPVAAFDAELGCVARPPQDEDGPPFSAFAYELYREREKLDDWQENLRTLYVACTRARDYLVLSAALTDEHSAKSGWMLTLTERFDLTTGQCIATDVPEDRKPRIHVFDRSRPIPELPARAKIERPVIHLPELPDWFEQKTHDDEEDVALVDSVGGPIPISGRSGVPKSTIKEIVCSVLSAREYRDPITWRSALESHRGRVTDEEFAELAGILNRFADSDLQKHIAGAETLLTEVPYVFDNSREKTETPEPIVQGTIDCLWRDARSRWHLVAFIVAISSETAARDNLVFAAAAMKDQLGYPSSLTIYNLRAGESARETAGRSSLARLLKEALGRLSDRSPTPSSR
jgi:ATP-dependent helicase/nuclease subunit A